MGGLYFFGLLGVGLAGAIGLVLVGIKLIFKSARSF